MSNPLRALNLALLLLLLLLLLLSMRLVPVMTRRASAAQAPAADALWVDVAEATIPNRAQRPIIPQAYRTLRLDEGALHALLATAPPEFSAAARAKPVVLVLPLPDGGLGHFTLVTSPIMAPALAAKFPAMTTYAGQGIDDPTATVRLDWTPAGFHAIIFGESGTIYIDPYSRSDTQHYISYYARDFVADGVPLFDEGAPSAADRAAAAEIAALVASNPSITVGTHLRTYRLAVAATGEFTQFHGGTVAGGLAAIVTTINRVSGVLEREVAARLELIANNNLLVYTDPATDPYSNSSPSTLLDENPLNLDAVIGNSNYDVGHVLGTGPGGVAYLGAICDATRKGGGTTGLPSPVGDPFYIDFVAHEFGHQFGANHTFNGTQGTCGGNRNGPTAYEPGSGSTIMSYSGGCSTDDIQTDGDAYYHTASFQEMAAFTTLGAGSTCGTLIATGNTPPQPAAGSGSVTIPARTPFALTGAATDADGDTLTYSWEAFDLGNAGPPNDPQNPPFFRSFNATSSPARTFPQWSDIVNNSATPGEILPNVTRPLTFYLTVRDNRSGGGGIAYASRTISVTTAAGPFRVTSPNTGVTWPVGGTRTVTWDVANTDVAPVNCSSVNITFSDDGGYTYPLTLAAGAPNDGAADVTLPTTPTATGRIQVACADNIFFDISDADIVLAPIVLDATGLMLANNATVTTWDTQTASGTPTFRTNRTPNGRPAVVFNGNDHMGGNVAVPVGPAGDFIVAAVVKPTSFNAYHNIIDDDPSVGPMLWIDPIDRYEFNFTPGGVFGGGPDGWDILIADAQAGKLYINGYINPQSTLAIPYSVAKPFDLLNRDGLQAFKGQLAELRVYTDRAAVGADFRDLYGDLYVKYLFSCAQNPLPVATVPQLEAAIACYNAAPGGSVTIDMSDSITLTAAATAINNTAGARLTVLGHGHSLDGQNSVRVLTLLAGDVTLDQLTIRNGHGAGGAACTIGATCGGGIYNGATLTLRNSMVATSSAKLGGGIFNNGTLTVSQTAVTGNATSATGTNFGGGIYNTINATLTIVDSTLTDNTAPGGGLYNLGRATVQGSTIADNSGSIGGGILNAGGAILTVTDSSFTANRGTNSGGGIYNEGSLTVGNSTFSGNMTSAQYSRGGGLAILRSGNAQISDSRFLTNTANYGGGIHSQGSVTVNNSTLSGNLAILAGGGLANEGSFLAGPIAVATIRDSTFAANRSSEGGAGLHNSSTLNVSGSTFMANLATGVSARGGGLFTGGTRVATVSNSTFSANSAYFAGGISAASTIHLINSTLVGNVGTADIGGFVNYSALNPLNSTMVNTLIANNVNGDCGAAPNNPLTVSHTIIRDGSCGVANGVGGNLIADPLLGALAANGGPTRTHALLAGSPAIDAGDNGVCPPFDQRIFGRQDGQCDIGAYEAAGVPTAVTITAAGVPVAGRPLHVVFLISLAISSAVCVYAWRKRSERRA